MFKAVHVGEFHNFLDFNNIISITDYPLRVEHNSFYNFNHLDDDFEEVVVKKVLNLDLSGSVLAVCDYGESRSTALAILFACKSGLGFEDAVSHVARLHPDFRLFSPNRSLLSQGLLELDMDFDLSVFDINNDFHLSEFELLDFFRCLGGKSWYSL